MNKEKTLFIFEGASSVDYDGHSSLADDEKIKEMLSFFNDETEEGINFSETIRKTYLP